MNKTVVAICFFITSLTMSRNISVLTYNIKYDNPSYAINNWDNRKAFLISQLNYNHPDVFGTQEGLLHQLEDFKYGLNDYGYIGKGRDFGDERGDFPAIFYNAKRVKCITNNTFWLSEKPNQSSTGWDATYNRICTFGVFQLLNSPTQFMVFTTQFDHIGDSTRRESANLLLKKIESLNPHKLPVLLMGDFNLETSSIGIQNILKYFKDSHSHAGNNTFGPTGTFNGFHFEKPVSSKIDYIFISNNIGIFKSGILSDSKDCHFPSDHFPVYADLNLKK